MSVPKLFTHHQAIACDIDLKHGWAGIIRARQNHNPDGDTWTLLDVQTFIEYDGKGPYFLGEKSLIEVVIARADLFLHHLYAEWMQYQADNVVFPYEPRVLIEYDPNRIHYKNARKLANIQNAHFIGALLYGLETHNELGWKTITPVQVRSVMKNKSHLWLTFASQTGIQPPDTDEGISRLPEEDRHGDMLDAVAMAFHQFKFGSGGKMND